MAWFLTVMDIARETEDGTWVPSGRYRQVATSDEDGGTHGLCKHEHLTKDEARACPEANASHHYHGLSTPRPKRA